MVHTMIINRPGLSAQHEKGSKNTPANQKLNIYALKKTMYVLHRSVKNSLQPTFWDTEYRNYYLWFRPEIEVKRVRQ